MPNNNIAREMRMTLGSNCSCLFDDHLVDGVPLDRNPARTSLQRVLAERDLCGASALDEAICFRPVPHFSLMQQTLRSVRRATEPTRLIESISWLYAVRAQLLLHLIWRRRNRPNGIDRYQLSPWASFGMALSGLPRLMWLEILRTKISNRVWLTERMLRKLSAVDLPFFLSIVTTGISL
jgi:hypothetical protein